jgi:hypothetical protein
MTPADTALALLRESRDGERIWHDDGETITRLARTAGVRVEYVRVNLTALTCERRIVEGGENHAQDFL